MIRLITLFLIAISYLQAENTETKYHPNDIYINDRQVFLNGEPFLVKGVNYSPIPIGASFNDDDKIGDVFFDYFNPVHEMDFKLMRSMGANTVRLYGMFPWHPLKGSKFPRNHTRFLDLAYNQGNKPIYVWISYPISSSIFRYKTVDQLPPSNEFHVKLPTGPGGSDQIWVTDENRKEQGYSWLGEQTAAQRRQSDEEAYLELAEKYKDHPAVFGWVLGNELNSPQNRTNPEYWKYLNDLAGELKEIAPTKETMVALIDDGMITLEQVKKLGVDVSNIDIWGINSYRGNVRGINNNFGSGEGSIFKEYAKVSNKPLIITEFGPSSTTRQEIIDELGLPVQPEDASQLARHCPGPNIVDMPDNANLAAHYLEGHWRDIVENRAIVAGGIVFEWQDEYWKAGNKNEQTPSFATNIDFPGGCWDEEGFGIHAVQLKRKSPSEFPAVFIPDERKPRAQYYKLQEIWNAPESSTK
jgi:hypothetical protein